MGVDKTNIGKKWKKSKLFQRWQKHSLKGLFLERKMGGTHICQNEKNKIRIYLFIRRTSKWCQNRHGILYNSSASQNWQFTSLHKILKVPICGNDTSFCGILSKNSLPKPTILGIP